jgi:signal transduction histidine kinase
MQNQFRTLRFKVAAAFLLWAAIFQISLVLLVPLTRWQFIMGEIDSHVRNEAAEVARELSSGALTPQGAITPQIGVRADGFGYQYQVLVQGRTLDSPRLAASPLEIPPTDHTDALTAPMVTLSTPVPGGAPIRYRTVSINTTLPDGTPALLTVASSLRVADWLQGLLRWLLLASLIPGLLGAALAGWIVAGLTASRIANISAAVRAISPTRLDRRLEVRGNDEVARMAADLNAMLDRLGGTISGLERFMSEVSHELKTPVSALLAEAQVMKYNQPTPEATHRFILSVEDEMRRLGKLVESFLMLARIEHGRRYLAERTVSINDVVLESVEHASRPAEQCEVGISLTLHDCGPDGREALVRGDPELLRIVLDNLLRNAIGFSDRGTNVSVSVDCNHTAVRIGVRDRGPGAPPEHIDRIFERFAQAPNQKPGRRGTGLGLAIAKGVVELHGGEIHAQNHPQGGCVFVVTLPLVAAQAVAVAPNGEAQHQRPG